LKQKNNNLISSILPIVLILLFAFFLRIPTFWLSHTNYDEMAYLSLALKLDKFGFKDFNNTYNLRNVDIMRTRNLGGPFSSEKEMGNILTGSGVTYEAKSPNHRPPLFSYLLMQSHRFFLKDRPYLVANKNLSLKSPFLVQLHAVIIPLIFSLALIFFTYLLGKHLFSQKVGVYAALFMSLSPIDLLVSQRVWAGDLLACLTTLAVLFYWLGLKKNKVIFSILAGISVGLAISTKMTGMFAIIAILSFHIWRTRGEWLRFNLKPLFLDRHIISLLLAAFLTSGPWLYIYYEGRIPFIQTSAKIPTGSFEKLTPWLSFTATRPWYMYLINPVVQLPVFIFAYWIFAEAFFKKKQNDGSMLLFFWFLTTVFVLSFLVSWSELRYLLPTYPSLAILASKYLLQLYDYLEKYLKTWSMQLLFIVLMLLNGYQALRLAIPLIVARAIAIPIPF